MRAEVLALVAIVYLSGCGASAIERSALAAHAMRDVLNTSATVIEAEAERELRTGATTEDRDAIQARWEPAQHAHNTAIEAWELWIQALLTAARREDFDGEDAIAIGREVLGLYAELARLLASLTDVDLPELPPFVLEIL